MNERDLFLIRADRMLRRILFFGKWTEESWRLAQAWTCLFTAMGWPVAHEPLGFRVENERDRHHHHWGAMR